MKEEEKMPIMIIFYFSQLSLLITQTNEIDLDSMSGDMIIFITVYYLNICIAFFKNILRLFLSSSSQKKKNGQGGMKILAQFSPLVKAYFISRPADHLDVCQDHISQLHYITSFCPMLKPRQIIWLVPLVCSECWRSTVNHMVLCIQPDRLEEWILLAV